MLVAPCCAERVMSLPSGIKLHEALRHAHGLPHHVKVWLSSQPSRKTTGLPPVVQSAATPVPPGAAPPRA